MLMSVGYRHLDMALMVLAIRGVVLNLWRFMMVVERRRRRRRRMNLDVSNG
jgi:hypothetical protein